MNTAVCVFVFIFYLRFLRSCTRLQKTVHPTQDLVRSCGTYHVHSNKYIHRLENDLYVIIHCWLYCINFIF
jgi:hypothetical protein